MAITVTFTPSLLAAESATMTVTDNAANNPQTASLAGTGILPVTLMPGSAKFGKLFVGTLSAPKTFTLKNNQSVALAISTVGISGPNAADFALTSACGASLAPNGKCTMTVTFTPSALGARSATLTVNDSAITSPQTASLTGTGK